MDQLRPTEPGEVIPNNITPPQNTGSVQVDINNNTPPPTSSKTLNMDNAAPETNKFVMDLFQDDIDTAFAKTKTPDAKPDVSTANVKYINPAPPIGSSGPISSTGAPLKSKEDFRSGVKAALMVVDYVISLIAMKIAGDVRQDTYTADTQQKKLLEDVLVEYLYGKQTQMPMWLTITLAVAGSYGLILFSAVQRRRTMNKNKKAYTQQKETTLRQTPRTDSGSGVTDADMKRYQDINPPVKKPSEKLQLETMYFENKKDGTLEPQQVPVQSYSDTLNAPTRQSTPQNPDPDLTAESSARLWELVHIGVYPMYKRNANGKIIKVKYGSNGMPIMQGRSLKLTKRRS